MASSSPINVILIEHDDMVRESTELVLNGVGMNASGYRTAEEARRHLDGAHIVLSDLRVPAGQDFRFTPLFQELVSRHIPLGIVSGSVPEDLEGYHAEFAMPKSGKFDFGELCRKIREAVQNKSL